MVAACGDEACDHVWVAVWLPMDMMSAAKVMQAALCPLCGSASVMMATSGQTESLGLATT